MHIIHNHLDFVCCSCLVGQFCDIKLSLSDVHLTNSFIIYSLVLSSFSLHIIIIILSIIISITIIILALSVLLYDSAFYWLC